jgi:hypothetical protein
MPTINARIRLFHLVLALSLAGCAAGDTPSMSERAGSPGQPATSDATATSASGATNPSPTSSPSPLETSCHGPGDFEPLPIRAQCWIDIATDDDMPVRVSYTIPGPGWSAFIGAYKDVEVGNDVQFVNVLIADIENVTINACKQQQPAKPPLGASVGDLAAALARLPPFEVTSPPADVTAYGYNGMHVQIRVPLDQVYRVDFGTFIGCQESVLRSWIATPLSFAFSGYVAPGDTEDFWILDVDGTRVVIVALATANASEDLRAEQQAVLDSIEIEP